MFSIRWYLSNICVTSENNSFIIFLSQGQVDPSKFKTIKEFIKYVARYITRPVMTESRIFDYDDINVTFWYRRHENNKIVLREFML